MSYKMSKTTKYNTMKMRTEWPRYKIGMSSNINAGDVRKSVFVCFNIILFIYLFLFCFVFVFYSSFIYCFFFLIYLFCLVEICFLYHCINSI